MGKKIPGALALIAAGTAIFHLRPAYNSGTDSGAARAAAPPPAMPAPVSTVVKKTMPITLDYSARTEAVQNVTLQVKVTGYLQSQVAPDGADVKAGDLL
jgi:multidrug efflux system membrane fusion protein